MSEPEYTRQEFLGGKVVLYGGDNRDVLRDLPDNSIDSVCTDPPYALVSIVKRFGKPGSAPAKGNDAYMRASAGFMGKQWDTGEVAFSEEFWREVLRVLKPGGHVAAFGASRGYHRMACAIEDAGFEIRDSLMWVYATGFPKSHDVSKGIAKAREEDVEPIRVVCRAIRAAMDMRGLKSRDLVEHFDGCHPRLVDHWAARDTDSQPALPTWSQWQTLRALLPLGDALDAEVWRLNGRKGQAGDAWQTADVIGEHDGVPGGFGDHRFSVRDNLVRQLSGVAAEWQGWGTALKPAFEPIVLARKPLSEKTVAANVLRWGTGALNIDGCRVGTEGATKRSAQTAYADSGWRTGHEIVKLEMGRWPANVVHDGSDEVVAAFPHTAPAKRGVRDPNGSMGYHGGAGGLPDVVSGHSDNGGSAARFFYSAKASKADRAGSKHPTVKPVKLLQWLSRLITPPGGTVLDPFAGSGTTAAACVAEGFKCVLIEREAEYVEDIKRRLSAPIVAAAVAAQQPANDNDTTQDDLFGATA